MSKNYLFDFGLADAYPGYTKVSESSVYQKETGFGFIHADKMCMVDRRTPKPLVSDFCIPLGNTFIVDIPNGLYTITVTVGDAILETNTTIKFNDSQVMIQELNTYPNHFVHDSFTVRVNEGQIKLTFFGGAPRINAIEIKPAPEAVSLFLAGDSTVADQPIEGYPYAGWGQCLPQFIKADGVVCNHAYSGRSSKSFIEEGRLDPILHEMKSGDFLFIQFGHNDQKPDLARHTDALTTYKEYLMVYIDEARKRMATPILFTSVHRRNFDVEGKIIDSHGDYLVAMKELAAEEGVLLVDLAEKTKTLYEELGPERSKSLFMWGVPGEFLNFPNGVYDNTHFQEFGANLIAKLVVEELKKFELHSLNLCLRL
ncbi:rhamnogalacturonan acetylesterase [Bacillus sp. PS06]|uniref:rhamnogalacturonan acetylesterase n=1 Tax=Bacillus sp. PS06 TaxID=2764176 RepID=UPI00177E4B8F|nr:rhamnogalacturonan acetylesterase [Bacillus sp. PS06]MBD8068691.1 GDSL family lipase [Bacillus sp. PS06]